MWPQRKATLTKSNVEPNILSFVKLPLHNFSFEEESYGGSGHTAHGSLSSVFLMMLSRQRRQDGMAFWRREGVWLPRQNLNSWKTVSRGRGELLGFDWCHLNLCSRKKVSLDGGSMPSPFVFIWCLYSRTTVPTCAACQFRVVEERKPTLPYANWYL